MGFIKKISYFILSFLLVVESQGFAFYLVSPAYADEFDKQRETCLTKKSMVWDPALNRCISKEESLEDRQSFRECEKIKDDYAKQRECFDKNAAEMIGSLEPKRAGLKEMQKTAEAMGYIQMLLEMIAKDGANAKCTSAKVMAAAGIVGMGVDIYLSFFVEDELKELQDKYAKNITKQKQVEKGTYEAQIEAFNYLQKEQETLISVDEKKIIAYGLMTGLNGIAMLLAIYEMTPFGAAGACTGEAQEMAMEIPPEKPTAPSKPDILDNPPEEIKEPPRPGKPPEEPKLADVGKEPKPPEALGNPPSTLEDPPKNHPGDPPNAKNYDPGKPPKEPDPLGNPPEEVKKPPTHPGDPPKKADVGEAPKPPKDDVGSPPEPLRPEPTKPKDPIKEPVRPTMEEPKDPGPLPSDPGKRPEPPTLEKEPTIPEKPVRPKELEKIPPEKTHVQFNAELSGKKWDLEKISISEIDNMDIDDVDKAALKKFKKEYSDAGVAGDGNRQKTVQKQLDNYKNTKSNPKKAKELAEKHKNLRKEMAKKNKEFENYDRNLEDYNAKKAKHDDWESKAGERDAAIKKHKDDVADWSKNKEAYEKGKKQQNEYQKAKKEWDEVDGKYQKDLKEYKESVSTHKKEMDAYNEDYGKWKKEQTDYNNNLADFNKRKKEYEVALDEHNKKMDDWTIKNDKAEADFAENNKNYGKKLDKYEEDFKSWEKEKSVTESKSAEFNKAKKQYESDLETYKKEFDKWEKKRDDLDAKFKKDVKKYNEDLDKHNADYKKWEQENSKNTKEWDDYNKAKTKHEQSVADYNQKKSKWEKDSKEASEKYTEAKEKYNKERKEFEKKEADYKDWESQKGSRDKEKKEFDKAKEEYDAKKSKYDKEMEEWVKESEKYDTKKKPTDEKPETKPGSKTETKTEIIKNKKTGEAKEVDVETKTEVKKDPKTGKMTEIETEIRVEKNTGIKTEKVTETTTDLKTGKKIEKGTETTTDLKTGIKTEKVFEKELLVPQKKPGSKTETTTDLKTGKKTEKVIEKEIEVPQKKPGSKTETKTEIIKNKETGEVKEVHVKTNTEVKKDPKTGKMTEIETEIRYEKGTGIRTEKVTETETKSRIEKTTDEETGQTVETRIDTKTQKEIDPTTGKGTERVTETTTDLKTGKKTEKVIEKEIEVPQKGLWDTFKDGVGKFYDYFRGPIGKGLKVGTKAVHIKTQYYKGGKEVEYCDEDLEEDCKEEKVEVPVDQAPPKKEREKSETKENPDESSIRHKKINFNDPNEVLSSFLNHKFEDKGLENIEDALMLEEEWKAHVSGKLKSPSVEKYRKMQDTGLFGKNPFMANVLHNVLVSFRKANLSNTLFSEAIAQVPIAQYGYPSGGGYGGGSYGGGSGYDSGYDSSYPGTPGAPGTDKTTKPSGAVSGPKDTFMEETDDEEDAANAKARSEQKGKDAGMMLGTAAGAMIGGALVTAGLDKLTSFRGALGKLGKVVDKVRVFFGTSPGIAVLSGISTLINGLTLGFAVEEKKAFEENVKKIKEIKGKFEEEMADFCPSKKDRETQSKPQCYCYTSGSARNPLRKNSDICKSYWARFDGSFFAGAGTYEFKGEKSIKGCVGLKGNYDFDCSCRKYKDRSTGQNACMKINNSFEGLGALGTSNSVGVLTSYANDFAEDPATIHRLDGDEVSRNAVKMKQASDKALMAFNKQRVANGEKPVVIGPKELENFTNKILAMPESRGAIKALQEAKAAPVRPPMALPKDLKLVEEKKVDLSKITYESTKKEAEKKKEEAKPKGPDMDFSAEEKKEKEDLSFMDKGFDYTKGVKKKEIVEKSDVSIFQVISNRYINTGLKLLFEVGK